MACFSSCLKVSISLWQVSKLKNRSKKLTSNNSSKISSTSKWHLRQRLRSFRKSIAWLETTNPICNTQHPLDPPWTWRARKTKVSTRVYRIWCLQSQAPRSSNKAIRQLTEMRAVSRWKSSKLNYPRHHQRLRCHSVHKEWTHSNLSSNQSLYERAVSQRRKIHLAHVPRSKT